jgi:hypothetical protein
LNDIKLSATVKAELKHHDKVRLGDSVCLSLHIHTGQNTCINCEPGEVMHKLKLEKEKSTVNAEFAKTKVNLDKQRKETAKSIKKKYIKQKIFTFPYLTWIIESFENFKGTV